MVKRKSVSLLLCHTMYVLDFWNINHLKSYFTQSCIERFHLYHAVNMHFMWVIETIH